METDRNYITIQRWMPKLGLTGNKLIVFALIYGFSQDGKSEFYGSLAYIADCVGITKRAVLDIVNELVKNGFIVKTQKTINGVKMCSYKVPNTKTENFAGGEKSSSDEPGKNLPPTYNNTLNSDNIPPYNPPQGVDSPQHFIFLWNQFVDMFAKEYPYKTPPAKIKSTTEVPNFAARTKELHKLVKDLLSCDLDGTIAKELEDRDNDVWRWAFLQIVRKVIKSSFLRGEAPTTDKHPKPFRMTVAFLMRKDNFIRMVSPNIHAFED